MEQEGGGGGRCVRVAETAREGLGSGGMGNGTGGSVATKTQHEVSINRTEELAS